MLTQDVLNVLEFMDFPALLNKLWVKRGLAFFLGALGALAYAPLFIFPALLLSISGIWFFLEQNIENNNRHFVVLGQGKLCFSLKNISTSNPKMTKAFWLGWWFGLGHFTAGLYWITFALAVDLASFWWLIPFALFGIPAILAVFTGFSFVLTALWPYRGLSRAFAFCAIWVGVEWLRGHLFTGFPWNLAGYAWAFSPEMTQIASLAGVYGLSLLTLFMGVSLGYFVKKHSFERNIALSVYLMAGLFWVWGHYRLSHVDTLSVPPLAIRLVQPSIPQTLKWDSMEKQANFKTLLELSTQPSSLPLKAIIWPESAIPFFLEQEPLLRAYIGSKLPRGALLFTGGLRRTDPGTIPVKAWNSLLVLNDEGKIIAHADKSHLVPFGEYLPFRYVLDGIFGAGTLKKITAGGVDFTAGPGSVSISLPKGFPVFTGLVCYEVIFPGAIINPQQQRPGWIINVTNDAWYGNTSGPYQHLETARFRAVEEGIPVVRTANTGVSAVFDGYGRMMGSLSLNHKGVLDIFLPAPTTHVPLYGRLGDWVVLILIIVTLCFAKIIFWRSERFPIHNDSTSSRL